MSIIVFYIGQYIYIYCIVAAKCINAKVYKIAALKDLFSHYVEAWKSWYSEVAGKKSLQIS
jgi:hypothetical protein